MFWWINKSSVRDVVGVQFRNLVTIGGTVYAKHGFSDLIPSLLALDSRVVFAGGGEISLDDYLRETQSRKQDIIEKIIIPKKEVRASYKAMRLSKGDYAILVVSVVKSAQGVNIAIGARPQSAILAKEAMSILGTGTLTEEMIVEASKKAAEELTFGTNTRGSKEYRKEICKVLVKRALKEVISCR